VGSFVNAKTWAAAVIGLGVWLLVATMSPDRPITQAEMLEFGLIAGLLAAVLIYSLSSSFVNAKETGKNNVSDQAGRGARV